jgi:hypothetical protein
VHARALFSAAREVESLRRPHGTAPSVGVVQLVNAPFVGSFSHTHDHAINPGAQDFFRPRSFSPVGARTCVHRWAVENLTPRTSRAWRGFASLASPPERIPPPEYKYLRTDKRALVHRGRGIGGLISALFCSLPPPRIHRDMIAPLHLPGERTPRRCP